MRTITQKTLVRFVNKRDPLVTKLEYSSILKYCNSLTNNDKIQTKLQAHRQKFQKLAATKALDFYPIYRNVCLKFLRTILRKLKIANFRLF